MSKMLRMSEEQHKLYQAKAEGRVKVGLLLGAKPPIQFETYGHKYRFILPFPPSANTMFPDGKNGRRFLSDKGKAFRKEVVGIVGRCQKLDTRLNVVIELYPPDRRKRDVGLHCWRVFLI